jgi:hypothetical protein
MFRAIDYDNLKEGDLIQFYGVHVLKWERAIRPLGIEPTIAFVEDDTQEQQLAAMREALEATQDIAKMVTFATDPRVSLNPTKAVDYFNRIFPEVAKALAAAQTAEGRGG